MKKGIRLLFFFLLSLGLLASLKVAWERIGVERANRSVTLAVDYQELARLALWTGLKEEEVLQRFKAEGVNAVLFKEQSLLDLFPQSLRLYSPNEAASLFPESRDEFRPGWAYFIGERRVLDRVRKHLMNKTPLSWQVVYDKASNSIQALGLPFPGISISELAEVGVGFPEDKMELVLDQGLDILPQLKAWPGASGKAVSAVLDSLAPYRARIVALLFQDRAVPGYPGALPELAAGVLRLGVPVGLIEFYPQQGLPQLALMVDKQAVRVHSLTATEAGGLSVQEAADRLRLAASERNARVLVLHLFFQGSPAGWLDANLKYVRTVASSLEREGLLVGRAQSFPVLPTSRVWWTFIVLGILAGGALLLMDLGPVWLSVGFVAVGLLTWLGALGLGYTMLARKLFALGAAVIFPTLAVWTAFRDGSGPLKVKESLVLVLKSTLFSVMGGLLLAGLLTDTTFFLKLNEFMGVKASFVLPLVLFSAAVFYREEGVRWRRTLRQWLGQNLTVSVLLWAAVGAAVFFLYLNRSGNESVGLLPLEGQLRSFLDHVLLVRPRTKEFLLGYPCFLLALSLPYQHRYLPLWLLALGGQISIVNTFAHLHTPLLVSLFRILNGLWVGLILGLAAVFAVRRTGMKLSRNVEPEE